MTKQWISSAIFKLWRVIPWTFSQSVVGMTLNPCVYCVARQWISSAIFKLWRVIPWMFSQSVVRMTLNSCVYCWAHFRSCVEMLIFTFVSSEKLSRVFPLKNKVGKHHKVSIFWRLHEPSLQSCSILQLAVYVHL